MNDIEEEPQTAMLLTDTEWKDLADMLAVYRAERNTYARNLDDDVSLKNETVLSTVRDIRRRIALADRIIEASK